jgi:2-alkyl-3-oxoalkanoate reductase
MRVLVTGGGGFVGRYVVERLVECGYPVRVLGRRRHAELDRLGVEMLQGDLADPVAVGRACDGVEIVHHVAACVELWHSAVELTRTNVEGTRNVVEACASRGVERLVFTSSASVVFGELDQKGVDESVPYPRRFTSLYPETKARAERLVLEANGRGRLRTVALRPHLVWGPRDTHFIPNLLARARRGGIVQVGDGRNLVDITYVENLADAHLLAARELGPDSPAAGRTFFISQGEPVEAWRFIGDLLERAGIARPTRRISYRRARLVGIACEMAWKLFRRDGAPPMTRFLAAQMSKSHYCDLSAARRLLGYQPRVSTAEGLERLGAGLSAFTGTPGVES